MNTDVVVRRDPTLGPSPCTGREAASTTLYQSLDGLIPLLRERGRGFIRRLTEALLAEKTALVEGKYV